MSADADRQRRGPGRDARRRREPRSPAVADHLIPAAHGMPSAADVVGDARLRFVLARPAATSRSRSGERSARSSGDGRGGPARDASSATSPTTSPPCSR